MRAVRVASIVLLASFLLPAGCSAPARQGQAKTSRQSIRNQSGTLRYPYELPKAARQFSLSLTMQTSNGSFAYALVDPQGAMVWEGRVDTGKSLSESRDLKSLPGKWVLTLTMENTTGSYEIGWASN